MTSCPDLPRSGACEDVRVAPGNSEDRGIAISVQTHSIRLMPEESQNDPKENAANPDSVDDLPEASSPPCYLNEFPPPEPQDVPAEANPVSELTPEEQMERFEKELKETDWGHQPC